MITNCVGVTFRAVCIAAGVQVRNETVVVSCYRSAMAAEETVFLLRESSIFARQNSSVLTAARSRSDIWDFPLRRQLRECKTETTHHGQTHGWCKIQPRHPEFQHDFEARIRPSGGHKLNSREPNITRGNMEQEKGGGHFESISQESV